MAKRRKQHLYDSLQRELEDDSLHRHQTDSESSNGALPEQGHLHPLLQLQQNRGNAYINRMLGNANLQRNPNQSGWEQFGAFGTIAGSIIDTVGAALSQGASMVGLNDQQKADVNSVGDGGKTTNTTVIDFSDDPEIIYGTPRATPPEATSGGSDVEAIQAKIAELKAKKMATERGETKGDDRENLVAEIKTLRENIAALDTAKSGMPAAELKTLKAQLYISLNQLTPYYFQINNLDMLWVYDTKKNRNPAPQRTCNITALSIALEGLGVSSSEFSGDEELLKLIWKYQVDTMNRISEADEERAVEKLKGKDKDTKEAALREKFLAERDRIAKMDTGSLRLPDFMQLVVIYTVLTQSGKFTNKMEGLNLAVSDLKAMAQSDPEAFKTTLDNAHSVARNAILFSGQFPRFAKLFGVSGKQRSFTYEKELSKMGEFGRSRWKIQELEEELQAVREKANSATDKEKTRLERRVKSLEGQIKLRTGKLKASKDFTSMDEFEDTLALDTYKAEVEKVFNPLLTGGKQVEISLENHFVYLVAIQDDGVIVHEVGEGDGKQLKLSWEKARALGYFQNYIVYER